MKGLEAEVLLAVLDDLDVVFSHRVQYLQTVRLLSVSDRKKCPEAGYHD